MGYHSEYARELQEQYDDEYVYMTAAQVMQEEEELDEATLELLDEATKENDNGL